MFSSLKKILNALIILFIIEFLPYQNILGPISNPKASSSIQRIQPFEFLINFHGYKTVLTIKLVLK